MKTIAVSLLLGAGALSMTVPASAEGMHSTKTLLRSTAAAQVDMSSRHRHRVRRASVPRNVFVAPPPPVVPYVLTYRTYGHAKGPPSPYMAAGEGLYTYAPLPYPETYGYAQVRYPTPSPVLSVRW